MLADAALVALPVLGRLAGAGWGALRARQRVTPVLPGDVPVDLEGRPLVPVEPTRLADPAERPRRNLVDPP